MWIRRGSRRVLLDALGANGGASQSGTKEIQALPQDEPQRDEVFLIWEFDPGSQRTLPGLVIVPNGELKDLLAWVSTFAPGFLPLTAFTRVLDLRAARTFWKLAHPMLGESESCCAGLILGEVISQAPERIEPTSLSPLGCASTLSYCMASALF